MYLAYLDDSEKQYKNQNFQVLSAVIMKDENIIDTEVGMMAVIYDLLPEEKREKFEEFHAGELFGGYGIFDGIDKARRFEAINYLVGVIHHSNIPIVYGAVDKKLLREKLYASAVPLDICFRICAKGVQEWMVKNAPDQQALLIADDCDGNIKTTIKHSFRQLRQRIFKTPKEATWLWNLHDGIYFGDSKDSAGIQLADLCSYFISKHLAGDASGSDFYQVIEKHIVYSKIEPQAADQK